MIPGTSIALVPISNTAIRIDIDTEFATKISAMVLATGTGVCSVISTDTNTDISKTT